MPEQTPEEAISSAGSGGVMDLALEEGTTLERPRAARTA